MEKLAEHTEIKTLDNIKIRNFKISKAKTSLGKKKKDLISIESMVKFSKK